MLRHGHLKTAIAFIEKYKGKMPLAQWLKESFKKDKKFGSKDRKYISHAIYCYYKIANALAVDVIETKILAGLFLIESNLPNLFIEIKPNWQTYLNDKTAISIPEKVAFLKNENIIVNTDNIFKQQQFLSNTINPIILNESYLKQSQTFLRLRPLAEIKKLEEKIEALEAIKINSNCYALAENKAIDEQLIINKEAVVQDWASQQVANYFPNINQPKVSIWDVCAGAGGKSLLAIDHYQNSNTTVSVNATDIRPAIIENYKTRMKEAGIKSFNTQVKDITTSAYLDFTKKYDLAICDVPCTGSGTWVRTPEAHYFFDEMSLRDLQSTQYLILSNAIKQMQPNTYVLYVTCSIFKDENELVIERVLEAVKRVSLEKSGIISGMENYADSMYAALLKVNA